MDFEGNLHSRDRPTILQPASNSSFKKSIVAKTHAWSQMGIRSMITYFWYVPKGYRKQHFHSLIAILKIGILIELFHNPWNPYYSCWFFSYPGTIHSSFVPICNLIHQSNNLWAQLKKLYITPKNAGGSLSGANNIALGLAIKITVFSYSALLLVDIHFQKLSFKLYIC